jgi:hypothetical protein
MVGKLMGGKTETVLLLAQKKLQPPSCKTSTSTAGVPVPPITAHLPNMAQGKDIYSIKLSKIVVLAY